MSSHEFESLPAFQEVPHPSAPDVLDVGVSEIVYEVRDAIHRFARDVMRPAGESLDRMSPEEVVAEGSPLYDVHRQYWELGLESLQELPPQDIALASSLAAEELGWGDAGLAISVGIDGMLAAVARNMGKPELAERFPANRISCWALTEPDHGSDMLDPKGVGAHARGRYGAPNCVVKKDGDGIRIRGQKSAWVSNGVIADQALLFGALDDGRQSSGEYRGCVVMVPLDAKGVSFGRPLDKIGQRPLPQGEIYFDDVRLHESHLVAGPDAYAAVLARTLANANSGMGGIFTGVARAAFEHALEYAHTRRQGGVAIAQHQSVRARLFRMYRQVELARSLSRRVIARNILGAGCALHGAIASKVSATELAFNVASEAMQIFGGVGVTRDYPVEKLVRDARVAMIEDGCNDFLAIKGGAMLVDNARLEKS